MKTLLCVFFKFKILKKALEHYIVKSPICKLYYKWKIIWKVWSIFVGQKFTGSSDESEVSPRGEIGSLVKIHLIKKFTGSSDESEVSPRGEIGSLVKIHLIKW